MWSVGLLYNIQFILLINYIVKFFLGGYHGRYQRGSGAILSQVNNRFVIKNGNPRDSYQETVSEN